jgi:hypothetical protein
VLDPGCGTGEERVADLGRRLGLLHELVVLGGDAVDARALLALGLLAELREHLLEVGDMPLRLLEVLLEALGELSVARLADHRRQLLEDLLLRVVDVLELVQEELPRLCHGRHNASLLECGPLLAVRGRFETASPGD